MRSHRFDIIAVAALVLAAATFALTLQGRLPAYASPDAPTAALAIANTLNYQGILRDEQGALVTGARTMTFKIYNDAVLNAPANLLYTQTVNNVPVRDGLFTVVLGDPTPLGPAVFADGPRFIGITVAPDSQEMLPRQRLHPVPWAQQATTALTANVANTLAPGATASGTTFARVAGTEQGVDMAVYGKATGTFQVGVYGENRSGFAVWGQGGTAGVYGIAPRGTSYGVSGDGGIGVGGTGSIAGVQGIGVNGGKAGSFSGDVDVQGRLTKTAGSFRIDHPLDPANKYLYHSFVESPDMMNVYNGNVTTDANGDATVTLPAYFEALNRDYRYQLTVVGQFAQAIVASKVRDNRFTIKTDKPNVEVSWQVTGIRQDAYARAYPIVVEEEKPAAARGHYLNPELYGQAGSPSVAEVLIPRVSLPALASEVGK